MTVRRADKTRWWWSVLGPEMHSEILDVALFLCEYRRINTMYYNNCYPSLSAINIYYAAEGITILLTPKRTMIAIFTALHGMQMRSSDENSVRPSVRLSVHQTRGL